MENIRTYIVSFSDSRKYLVRDTPVDASRRIDAVKRSLSDYLCRKFPENAMTPYTTPDVVEVGLDKEEEYENYAEFDATAVESIRKELEDEIMNLNANREMDLNAPFADVDAQAAEVTEALFS